MACWICFHGLLMTQCEQLVLIKECHYPSLSFVSLFSISFLSLPHSPSLSHSILCPFLFVVPFFRIFVYFHLKPSYVSITVAALGAVLHVACRLLVCCINNFLLSHHQPQHETAASLSYH